MDSPLCNLQIKRRQVVFQRDSVERSCLALPMAYILREKISNSTFLPITSVNAMGRIGFSCVFSQHHFYGATPTRGLGCHGVHLFLCYSAGLYPQVDFSPRAPCHTNNVAARWTSGRKVLPIRFSFI